MPKQDATTALRWVQRNRCRRRSVERPASDAVGALARALAREDGGRLSLVRDVLDGLIDDDFREKCAEPVLQGAILHVRVAAPSWVSVMQRRWGERLEQAFREQAPRLRIRGVRFEFGAAERTPVDRP